VHLTERALVTLVVVKVDMINPASSNFVKELVGTGLKVQVSERTSHVHCAFPSGPGSPHLAWLQIAKLPSNT
jgi:hypothetical protein